MPLEQSNEQHGNGRTTDGAGTGGVQSSDIDTLRRAEEYCEEQNGMYMVLCSEFYRTLMNRASVHFAYAKMLIDVRQPTVT